MSETGKFIFGDKTVEMPIKHGSIGPAVADIAKLYGQTGMFTYDPGFTSRRAANRKITYIDGDEGVLLYRGYPIEQLAEHGDFLESCYLLLYGELPTPAQKADFDYRITRHTMVHEQWRILPGLPPRRPPDGGHGRLRSARCRPSITTRPIFRDPAQRMIASMRMIAKMPTHGRHGLQISDRPALRLSQERSRLHGEFPAHVLRRALRGIQGQPDPVARARPHLHPARRP